nr:immunoglobulin light chain junction region [Macaca mulatta]MOX73672.1 immunoglobulin light chain junction region [Macaca mulatta]
DFYCMIWHNNAYIF